MDGLSNRIRMWQYSEILFDRWQRKNRVRRQEKRKEDKDKGWFLHFLLTHFLLCLYVQSGCVVASGIIHRYKDKGGDESSNWRAARMTKERERPRLSVIFCCHFLFFCCCSKTTARGADLTNPPPHSVFLLFLVLRTCRKYSRISKKRRYGGKCRNTSGSMPGQSSVSTNCKRSKWTTRRTSALLISIGTR